MPNAPKNLDHVAVVFNDEDVITGQKLLTQALHRESRNEYAWLLLATILDDYSKQYECIQRALRINPASGIGKKLMLVLESM